MWTIAWQVDDMQCQYSWPHFVEHFHEAVIEHEGDCNIQAHTTQSRKCTFVESATKYLHMDLIHVWHFHEFMLLLVSSCPTDNSNQICMPTPFQSVSNSQHLGYIWGRETAWLAAHTISSSWRILLHWVSELFITIHIVLDHSDCTFCWRWLPSGMYHVVWQKLTNILLASNLLYCTVFLVLCHVRFCLIQVEKFCSLCCLCTVKLGMEIQRSMSINFKCFCCIVYYLQ